MTAASPDSGVRLGDDAMPEMRCPGCHAEHPDYDGFGFIAHTKPAYKDGCGWCSHPNRDGAEDGITWTCTICGDVSVDTETGSKEP